MSRFDSQVVVVTGAAGGLGRASAHLLSTRGAAVVAVDTDPDRLAETCAGLPGPSEPVVADVSRPADVARYMAAGIERFGHIDHHHLNAGISGSVRGLLGADIEEFDRVLAVNMRGVFLGLREAFRHYSIAGHRGAIAVTASIASQRGSSDLFAYHASKHGVIGLVENAAVYGGPLGIRVNAVAPGIVPTDLFGTDRDTAGGANDMARRAGTTPLRRPGRAEEIAGVVAFLLSDDASYVTGEVIAANGGATAVNTVRPGGGAGAWDTAVVDAAIRADFDLARLPG